MYLSKSIVKAGHENISLLHPSPFFLFLFFFFALFASNSHGYVGALRIYSKFSSIQSLMDQLPHWQKTRKDFNVLQTFTLFFSRLIWQKDLFL